MWVAAVIGFWTLYPQFYVCNIYKPLLLKHNTRQHNTLLSVTKTNLLREGKQIATVHCDSQVKPINKSSGYNEEIFNVGMLDMFLPLI
jgi:hypothetical protein